MAPNIPGLVSRAMGAVGDRLVHYGTIAAREGVIAGSNIAYPSMYTRNGIDRLRRMDPAHGLNVALATSGTGAERRALNVATGAALPR